MKRLIHFVLLFATFTIARYASAQSVGALPVQYCYQGGEHAQTNGLLSSNYMQGVIPSCTVSVYLTGSTTLATIYSDVNRTVLTNPFTANSDGQFTVFAASSQAFDVKGSGGNGNPNCTTGPTCYSSPTTLAIDIYPSSNLTPITGVVAFSGDGALLSNVSSTGNVTATLANAAGDKVWGNCNSTTGAPSYCSLVYAMFPNSGVTPGSYTNVNATVNAQGIITAISNGGGGTFNALSGDATSTPTGGATTVVGLDGVAFCLGYTPTNGEAVTFTTGGSPNPCYTAVTPSGGGVTIQTNTSNNASQTTLNFETSTANSAGLIVTPSNPSGGIEKEEVTGSYSGTLVSSQVTAALGFTPTNAAVVPSTTPVAGQILVGNAGGTAYAPVTVSGSCTNTFAGVFTCSGTSLTLQTNGVGNSSSTLLNMETSTANSVGLTVTPSNPSGGIEKWEVTGSSYAGNAATATLATGATNVAGGVANDIPYQTGVGATSFIAPVNNALVVTSSGGVPSESTTLPSSLTIPSPALTGTPTAPTQSCASNTDIATGAYVAACGGSGTTTNPLTGAVSGGAAPNSTFNGSAPVTFDYHTFGASQALGNATEETTSWSIVANNNYRFTGSGASNATTPATTGATGVARFINVGTANVTVVTGGPTLVCNPASCVAQTGASVVIYTDGTDQYADISSANGSAFGTFANLNESDLGTVTYNASGTTTFAAGSAFNASGIVTATHSTSTSLSPTGLVKWGNYQLEIKQDSTGGGVTFTLGTGGSCSAWKVGGGGSGTITLSTAASAIDFLAFTYDGTNCVANFRQNFD